MVLFYHLGFEWMQGGFLGVDIFLVLSGYFISKNLLFSLQNNKFSFLGFYANRLRRLFPALISTLLLVLILGHFLLSINAYERLGASTFFASLSASNFFFWKESGYFDTGAFNKPLLHMWSLSLEEQFYLLWPLLLFLIFKKTRKLLGWIVIMGIALSLFLCQRYYSSDPSAVFFLLPFRMFEFLLGILCIGVERHPLFKNNALREILFLLGLISMLGSAVMLSGDFQMPGLLSLIPAVGAMMVIIGGHAQGMSWTLKNSAMEYIGKASYSIYLIHWPFIVFYKIYKTGVYTFTDQLLLGAISIVSGFLMWKFIENTFRYRKSKHRKIDTIWLGVPGMILLLAFVSHQLWKDDHFLKNYSDVLYLSHDEVLANRDRYLSEFQEGSPLLQGKPGAGHVMVLGNSHAVDLMYMLRMNGFESKITYLNSRGLCLNFGYPIYEKDSLLCKKQRIANLKNKDWATVDAIYLHDNWSKYERSTLQEMLFQIREISKAPIFVIGPKMTFEKDIPEIVAESHSLDPEFINCFSKEYERNWKIVLNDQLKEEFRSQLYRDLNIYYVDLLRVQGGLGMDDFKVVSEMDLSFFYFDWNHFTPEGAKKVGHNLKAIYPELFKSR